MPGGNDTARPPALDPRPPAPGPRPPVSVLLFRLAGWLAARLPLPLGYRLAGALGDLYFWLNPGHSRHAVANLAVVLAQHPAAPAVRRLARRSFRYYAMYMLDFLRLPAQAPRQIERSIVAEGWEHLEAALARGRGVIVVAVHFGSWDRASAALIRRGYRVTVLADTFQPPALDAEIQRTRAAQGLTVVPAEGGAALRAVYAALRRNEIVALFVDRPLLPAPGQVAPPGAAPVTLFGRRTWLPSGPAALALRTGAALLHAHLLRRPGLLTFQGVIEPEISIPLTGDRAADEAALMQAVAERFQRLIQRHPEQWYMFRPFWPADDA